ncbi:hypothetical protein ACF1AJ_19635 [Leifsonia sp. NPDC014704]|uniref:XRE family transcriptional regulator n=1 Tax=Leifsonia virtsii TaxID=3035915 RepID=A0ABT8J2N0_9MICO|nr:hypothetical protein [Leifsonia virtsii]MDN4599336.1 hypothetical protein [Leifsonia virtsii]
MSRVLEAPTPRRKRQQAHLRALESEITPAVKSLVETLGKALVAVIVNRDVKTVTRWVAGQGPRGDDEQRRVIDTLQIVELLLSGDSPSVVRAWFMGMNPQLDDENPAEVLAAGRAREVMAAARAFVNAD